MQREKQSEGEMVSPFLVENSHTPDTHTMENHTEQ